MDNKVKITLLTTGVLLLLIISYGLYTTFNPEIELKKSVRESCKDQPPAACIVRVKLGEKSNLDIRTNDYYFPKQKVCKEKIDPDNSEVKAEEDDDGFFKSENADSFDITADFDEDYVQAPDVSGMMDPDEAAGPEDSSEQFY